MLPRFGDVDNKVTFVPLRLTYSFFSDQIRTASVLKKPECGRRRMRVMRYIGAALGFALLSACGKESTAQLQSVHTQSVDYLSIVVKNLRLPEDRMLQRDTEVCFAVFAGPEGFPSNEEKIVAKGCKPVTSRIVSFLIEDLPASPEGYAISFFQDVNMNGKLDTRRIFGIEVPEEPFGFTQNPALTGAPTYDKCKINPVRNGEKFEIVMKKIGG